MSYCDKCGYDLRGLPGPHCPECGHPFDPTDPDTFRVARRSASMFCRQCHADLCELPGPQCPNCGTPFDSEDADSFLVELPDDGSWGPVFGLGMSLIVAVVAALIITLHLAGRVSTGGH